MCAAHSNCIIVHQPRTQKSSNSSTLLHLEIEYLILASMESLGTLYTESANKKSKRLARSAGGSRQSDHFWHFIDGHCCDLNPISNQCHARFRNELSDFCELRENLANREDLQCKPLQFPYYTCAWIQITIKLLFAYL